MLRKLPNKQGATRSHIGPLSKDRPGPSDDDDDDEMHRGSGAVFAPAADGLTAIHRRHRLYRRRPAVELRTTNWGDVRSHHSDWCLFVCLLLFQTYPMWPEDALSMEVKHLSEERYLVDRHKRLYQQ